MENLTCFLRDMTIFPALSFKNQLYAPTIWSIWNSSLTALAITYDALCLCLQEQIITRKYLACSHSLEAPEVIIHLIFSFSRDKYDILIYNTLFSLKQSKKQIRSCHLPDTLQTNLFTTFTNKTTAHCEKFSKGC